MAFARFDIENTETIVTATMEVFFYILATLTSHSIQKERRKQILERPKQQISGGLGYSSKHLDRRAAYMGSPMVIFISLYIKCTRRGTSLLPSFRHVGLTNHINLM